MAEEQKDGVVGTSSNMEELARVLEVSLDDLKPVNSRVLDQLYSKLKGNGALTSRVTRLQSQLKDVLQRNELVAKERDSVLNELQFEKNQTELIQLDNENLKEQVEGFEDSIQKDRYIENKLNRMISEKCLELVSLRKKIEETLDDNKTLRGQVDSLVRENEKAIASIENKQMEIDRRIREIKTLEKEKNLLEGQLSDRTDQFDAYRKESSERSRDLANEISDLKNTILTETAEKEALNVQYSNLSKTLNLKITEMSRKYSSMKANFIEEISMKNKSIELMKRRISLLEKFDSVKSLSDDDIAPGDDELLKELAETRESLKSYQSRCSSLEQTLQDIRSEPHRSFSSNTEDIVQLKTQLVKEQKERELLQEQVELFVLELEKNMPAVNSFKEKIAGLKQELNKTTLMLEHVTLEKASKVKEVNALQQKLEELSGNINTLSHQRIDLAHQVQFLLLHSAASSNNKALLSPQEIAFVRKLITNDQLSKSSDSQAVISERLRDFADVPSLQQKNMELLQAIRKLASKHEAEEIQAERERLAKVEYETINDAKQTILDLNRYTSELEESVSILTRERDSYKAMLSTKEADTKAMGRSTGSAKIVQLEKHLEVLAEDSKTYINQMVEDIRKSEREKSGISVELSKAQSEKTMALEECKSLEVQLQANKDKIKQLLVKVGLSEKNFNELSSRTSQLTMEKELVESKVVALEETIQNLRAENQQLKGEQEQLVAKIQAITTEKNDLQEKLRSSEAKYEENMLSVRANNQVLRDQLLADREARTESTKIMESRINELVKLVTESRSGSRQVSGSNDELEALSGKLKLSTDIRYKLENDVNILTKQLRETEARLESYKVLGDVGDVNARVSKLTEELESANVSLEATKQELESQKEERVELLRVLSEKESSISRLQEELNKVNQEYTKDKKSFEEKLEEQRKVSKELNKKIHDQQEDHRKEISKLDEEILHMKEDNKDTEDLKKQYSDRVATLQQKITDQQSEMMSLQVEHESRLSMIDGLQHKLFSLQEIINNKDEALSSLEDSKKMVDQELLKLRQESQTNIDELTSKLEVATTRLDDIMLQNNILFERLESATEIATDDDLGSAQLIASLKHERTVLEQRLAIVEKQAAISREEVLRLTAEIQDAKGRIDTLQAGQSSSQEFSDEIKEQLEKARFIKDENEILGKKLAVVQSSLEETQKKLTDLQEHPVKMEGESKSLAESINEKDMTIGVLRNEIRHWKELSQDLMEKQDTVSAEKYKELEANLEDVRRQLEERIQEKDDLEDKFARLKKQANERLHASKSAQSSLAEQLEILKQSRLQTEATLQQKIKELESQVQARSESPKQLESLKTELSNALRRAADSEKKLQDLGNESEKIKEQLSSQLNAVSSECKRASDEQVIHGNMSQVVEDMKKEFEAEKIAFIQQKTSEMEEKLQKAKEEFFASQEGQTVQSNVDELKAKWEQEYEKLTLERIEEAKDNLKRRIRLPTEEKIQKIIEKRRAELETDYQKKLEEVEKLAKGVTVPDDVKAEIRNSLEKELTVKFEGEMAAIKKKAFEEGQQQASMKTTLLERKISKLEAQLKHSNGTSENAVASPPVPQLPSKIDEASPIAVLERDANTINTASGDKVLKLKSNPFSSVPAQFTSNSFAVRSQQTVPAFGMKPAFSFGQNPFSSSKPTSAFGAFASANNSFGTSTVQSKENESEVSNERESTALAQESTSEQDSLAGKRAAEENSNDLDGSPDTKRTRENVD